jgi:hypothetical protein
MPMNMGGLKIDRMTDMSGFSLAWIGVKYNDANAEKQQV